MSLTNSSSHESDPNDIHGADLRSEDAAHGADVVPRAEPSRGAWLVELWQRADTTFISLMPDTNNFPARWSVYGASRIFSTLLDRNRLRGCVSERHYYVDDALSVMSH